MSNIYDWILENACEPGNNWFIQQNLSDTSLQSMYELCKTHDKVITYFLWMICNNIPDRHELLNFTVQEFDQYDKNPAVSKSYIDQLLQNPISYKKLMIIITRCYHLTPKSNQDNFLEKICQYAIKSIEDSD